MSIRNRISNYRKWQDSYASVLGFQLLKKGLVELEQEPNLEPLKFDRFNRPFLSDSIDFNISHSSEYVVCAISNEGRVGLDIEKIKNIDLPLLNMRLMNEEIESITGAPDPQREFYRLWTRKEAVAKADGRGLSVPFESLDVMNHQIQLDNKIWHLAEVFIDIEYCCHIATDNEIIGSIRPTYHAFS